MLYVVWAPTQYKQYVHDSDALQEAGEHLAVINKLSQGNGKSYINYRDSKMTRIL